jgi:hypothetical protein
VGKPHAFATLAHVHNPRMIENTAASRVVLKLRMAVTASLLMSTGLRRPLRFDSVMFQRTGSCE